MRHLLKRSATVLTISLLLLLTVGATVAFAHMKITARNPAANASVKKTLAAVTITFNQQVKSGTLTVKNAAGTKVSVGTGGIDPRNVKRLSVALKKSLAAGTYKATWTAKGPDGHTQTGSWSFKLTN